MGFVIKSMEQEHLQGALKLVLEGYREEKEAVPFLPEEKELLESIQSPLKAMLAQEKGLVAMQEDRVMGFIIGYSAERLFGNCRGIYVPLFGQGAKKERRQAIYRDLYARAAEQWVEEEKFTHAITFFAHDREAIDTWFWLGFGLRCVDAIRKTELIETSCRKIDVKKAEFEDLPLITSLYEDHCSYYCHSPIFMQKSCENPLQELEEWLAEENHHLWFALEGGKPLGYMQLEPTGETFVSTHPQVMNITGAFVEEKARCRGTGRVLLAATQQWLQEKDYLLCGVDFESLNIAGSKFWNRFFVPYTFSLVRRIDERLKE